MKREKWWLFFERGGHCGRRNAEEAIYEPFESEEEALATLVKLKLEGAAHRLYSDRADELAKDVALYTLRSPWGKPEAWVA